MWRLTGGVRRGKARTREPSGRGAQVSTYHGSFSTYYGGNFEGELESAARLVFLGLTVSISSLESADSPSSIRRS